MLLIPPALCLPRGQTAFVVRIRFEGRQLGQGIDLAFKGDLGGSQQLLILLRQIILLLQLPDDGRVKGLFLDLSIQEHQFSILGGKLRAELAAEHGRGPLLAVLLQLRPRLVEKLHFPVIKGVPGIDAVAHIGQVVHGA